MQTYSLRCGTVEMQELVRFIRSVDEEDCPLDDDGYADYVPDWACGAAMAKLSGKFPKALISLETYDHEAPISEESWVEYWLNGMRQSWQAEVVFPEPDPSRWVPCGNRGVTWTIKND